MTVEQCLRELFPNDRRVEYSIDNKKLYVTRRARNNFYYGSLSGEAFSSCFWISLLAIGFLGTLFLLAIPSVLWSNILFYLTVVGWTLASFPLFGATTLPERIIVTGIIICISLAIMLICWQIQITHPNDYPQTSLPYLDFLFRFKFK